MAFSYAQLAGLYSKYGSNDYKKCLRSASAIYDTSVHKYHEDKMVLLNNVGLNLHSQKRYAEALQLYQQAIALAELYLPRNDHRVLVIKNNLACTLMSA